MNAAAMTIFHSVPQRKNRRYCPVTPVCQGEIAEPAEKLIMAAERPRRREYYASGSACRSLAALLAELPPQRKERHKADHAEHDPGSSGWLRAFPASNSQPPPA